MKKLLLILILFLIVLMVLTGCGGGNGDNPPATPPGETGTLKAPTNLTAIGSLRKIQLNWTSSASDGVTGYKIYRSANGSSFTQHATVAATATSYDDVIASPAGDGIFYHYRVTTVGNGESPASNTVKSMHGTRLAVAYTGGFTTQAADSPYVAEGGTVVDGDNFTVAKNTKLYILDNSIIDLEAERTFQVNGLLRVVASSGANHATFTAHKDGGLANGEGFYLYFSAAAVYNPTDDSGTMLQYLRISNLRSSGSMSINAGGIKLYNVKITSNHNNGGSYFTLSNTGWAIIRNCSFEKIVFKTSTDLRATPFEMKRNIFRGGYYSIYFNGLANPGVNPRQIEENDFDASKQAYLFNMTGDSNVPLGNNYWHGGFGNPPAPNVSKGGTTDLDINFNDPSSSLANAPAGVGPDW